MQQNAVQAVSARRGLRARLAIAGLFGLFGIGAAAAGDRAVLDPIGFSPSGEVFAFEEFGMQDGSGFVYSNLYVVDLAADKWIAGSPFRNRSDSEEVALADIRAKSREQAAAALAQYEISVPAEPLVINGDADTETDLRHVRFGMPMSGPKTIHDPRDLTLAVFDTAAAEPCQDYMDEKPKGFALTLTTGGEAVELHRDGALPKSRGCGLDYGIYGVFTPFGDYGFEHGVALVSVYSFGFEGPDRRFVAVPLGGK
jgi:predicted secreted protein